MGIIIALLIFGLIVTIHEFGHFICAKLSGIKVNEFSIGMGPKIIQRQKGETMYSLRWLPVGGYCAMEGEDEENPDARAFRNAKLWKRMIVLFAGAFMNFVLGFVLIIGMLCMMPKVPTTSIYGFTCNEDRTEITAESYNAGLQYDDVIKEIDGTHIYSFLDIDYILETSKTYTHDVVVKRGGKTITFEDITIKDTLTNSKWDFDVNRVGKNPLTVIKGSGQVFMSMGHIIGLSLKQMITGKIQKDEIQGPVGIVTTINETAKSSKSASEMILSLLYMAAMITVNVGIFNLLPFPALDGGRLLFCFIELVRRKPVKPEHEGYVHFAGMVLLIGVMIFATYNDIARIFSGG